MQGKDSRSFAESEGGCTFLIEFIFQSPAQSRVAERPAESTTASEMQVDRTNRSGRSTNGSSVETFEMSVAQNPDDADGLFAIRISNLVAERIRLGKGLAS